MNKKKCLISGSNGFIASNFIRKSLYEKQPYEFVGIDNISKGSVNNIYINKDYDFHIGDINDSHFLDVIFAYAKPDVVLHMAAETFVDTSLTNPNLFIQTNIMGTQNIINACLKHKVEKLIYCSTDEIYGHLESESDPSWTENNPMNPRSPYSASKAAAELLVQSASIAYGLKYNITRSSNNYGPRQYSEKLIPKVIKCILNDEKIPIYGQGLQIRDWLNVYDNCSAILKVISDGKDNEIYNIGANQEFTNIEVVQHICNALGKGHNLISFIEDPRKNSHDFRYSVDCTKIKKLGWKPEFKFKDEIVNVCEWFKGNSWWFKQ